MTTEPDVIFSFDPACPWTWVTSRWLVEVAETRSLRVAWRPLSLKVLNGENIPPQYREFVEAAFSALRVVQALRGDDELIGRFYTELGTRVHVQQQTISLELVREAAAAAGVDAAPIDDTSLDGEIVEATHAVVRSAGGEVGSPIITLAASGRAMHGPIVSPAPRGDEAVALWDAVTAALAVPSFYEMKRGRTAPPDVS